MKTVFLSRHLKVFYKCNPDIILTQNRLFLDMKGHWETAGKKWRGSLSLCRICVWRKKSLQEKVCLSVSEEEGLSKSRPILDRRSPHSITSYQPHITHLIYLPLPSHSSFTHCPWTSPFLLSLLLSLLLLPSFLHFLIPFTIFLVGPPWKQKVQVALYSALHNRNLVFGAINDIFLRQKLTLLMPKWCSKSDSWYINSWDGCLFHWLSFLSQNRRAEC